MSIRMRDLAMAAGCSVATVSLALRNSPRISRERRRAIQALAREMGYRPNPLAAAFHAEVRRGKGGEYRATMGWVNDSPEERRWEGVRVYEAARERAAELGYGLDVVHVDPREWMDAPGELARRFQRILRARGIYGVVLPGLYRPALAVEEWPEVAVVCVGQYAGSLKHTRVARARRDVHHTVAPDVARNVALALERMEAVGVRRVGLAVTQWWDWMQDHAALGRYLVWSEGMGRGERVPPFVFATVESERTRREYGEWLRRWKPQAVLCSNRELLEWTRGAGWAVPGQVRLVHLEVSWEGEEWTGVDESPERLGRTAVEELAALLQRNERGLPTWPRKVLVAGEWRAGRTG